MSILLTKDTRFIIQGITGREAINLTRENLDYGAKIVGGVTPGRAGRDVYGVPVYDSVRDAVAANGGSIEGSIVSSRMRLEPKRLRTSQSISPVQLLLLNYLESSPLAHRAIC